MSQAILSWIARNGTIGCLKDKKSIKSSTGNSFKHAEPPACSFTFFGYLKWTLFNLSSRLHWSLLCSLLCSLDWTLMYSQWGQRSWEWRVNAACVHSDEKLLMKIVMLLPACIFFNIWGKVDLTLMLFVTRILNRFDLNQWPLTFMWLCKTWGCNTVWTFTVCLCYMLLRTLSSLLSLRVHSLLLSFFIIQHTLSVSISLNVL